MCLKHLQAWIECANFSKRSNNTNFKNKNSLKIFKKEGGQEAKHVHFFTQPRATPSDPGTLFQESLYVSPKASIALFSSRWSILSC